jgi:hypothetical protein
LADSAPVADVEDLVQPLQGCIIELEFSGPIEPGELIDGSNADDGRSDGGVLEHPGSRNDVLRFPELAQSVESPGTGVVGTDRIPYSSST